MDFIFAASLWLTVIVAAAGAALCYGGLRRGDATLRNLGAILFLVGLIWTAAARFVETDTELADRQSVALVDAVSRKDWDAVEKLLRPDALLALPNTGTIYDDRNDILTAGKLASLGSRFPNVKAINETSAREGDSIVTTLDVVVSYDAGGVPPNRTSWRFMWVKSGGTWVVRQIDGLDMGSFGGRGSNWFPRLRGSGG